MSPSNGNGTSGSLLFDEAVCERYLFGELDGAEQERFESAYFNDDSFFNRFLAVKDELLDLYSRNELETGKRIRMERHFRASGPRQTRIIEADEFILSVTQLAERSVEPVRPLTGGAPIHPGYFASLRSVFTPSVLAATAGIILLAILGFWIFGGRQTPELSSDPSDEASPKDSVKPLKEAIPDNAKTAEVTGPSPQGSDDPQPRPDRSDKPEVAADPSRPVTADEPVPEPRRSPIPPQSEVVQKDPIAPDPVPSVRPPVPNQELTGAQTESVILDSATRSITRQNTASIGSATQRVTVRLIFGGEPFGTYSVRITTIGGASVWQASGLRALMNEGPKYLTITVPASALSRKDYIVVVDGVTEEGKSRTIREYYLHVDRQ